MVIDCFDRTKLEILAEWLNVIFMKSYEKLNHAYRKKC